MKLKKVLIFVAVVLATLFAAIADGILMADPKDVMRFFHIK